MSQSVLKLSVVPESGFKNCSNKKCNQVNPQSIKNFYKQKSRLDGLTSPCKFCCLENKRKAHKLNPGKRKIRDNKYYYTNYEKNRERIKQNYLNNPLIKIKLNEYRKNHPEKSREHSWKQQGILNSNGTMFKWEDYKNILKKQKWTCFICHTDNPGKLSWSVDHNHENGFVRAILCHNCNLSLGAAKDNVITLLSMITYLVKFREGRRDEY